MTTQELQNTAKKTPEKMLYLAEVAELLGMGYRSLKEHYVYTKKIIPTVRGPKEDKYALMVRADDAWDFVDSYIKVKNFKKQ